MLGLSGHDRKGSTWVDRRVFPLEAPDDILAVAYRVPVEGLHRVVVRVACHANVPPYADNGSGRFW